MDLQISISSVYKNISNRLIIKDFSFDFLAKKKYALIGENGSGKSSLINLIVGYWHLSSGVISPNPNNINKIKKSVIFQSSTFDEHLSVWDNLRIISKLRKIKFTQQILLFRQICSEALDIIIPEKTPMKFLSDGQRRAAEIAGLFDLDADLLITDELCNGLDILTRQRLINWLNEKTNNYKGIMIVSTHSQAEFELCDEYIYLNHGRIASLGSTSTTNLEEVMRKNHA